MMRQFSRFIDYLIELNIILLIFSFPLIQSWFNTLFNNFWGFLPAIWLLRKILSPDKSRIAFPPSGLLWSLFIGTVISSNFFAEQPSIGLKNSIYFLKGIMLSIVIYDFSNQDERRIKRIIYYFIISSVLVAQDAIVQTLFSKDVMGIPLRDTRATAFFVHPFHLALWSAIGLFLTIDRLNETSSRRHKIIYQICIIILGSALLLSKTRAVWIAAGCTLLIMFFSSPYKKDLLKITLLLGVIIFIIFVIDNSMRAKALSIINTMDPRWTIWEQSLIMIKEKFTLRDYFFGRGPGSFKLDYPQFDISKGGEVFPHMIAIELFYALGFLGFLAFFFWITHYVYKLFSLTGKGAVNIWVRHIGLIPLLILLIHFINESFFSRYFSFTFWFFMGLSMSLLYSRKCQFKTREGH